MTSPRVEHTPTRTPYEPARRRALVPLLAALLLAAPGCGRDEAAPWEEPATVCVPACGAGRCGEEDGCGGRCACEHEASCLSCPLRLVRVGEPAADGTVSVAVESSAVAAVPLPRLADLVVAADRPGRWLTLRFAVEAGEAGDVRFHLVRRLDAVAPAAADGALRDSRYDKPLLVQVGR